MHSISTYCDIEEIRSMVTIVETHQVNRQNTQDRISINTTLSLVWLELYHHVIKKISVPETATGV